MNWTWSEGSLLKNYNEYTSCKDIFKAVCDEIGRYYEAKGWKYSRSRPKITFKNNDIKLEVAFWSSGSNMPGSYVNLEIIPSISAPDFVQHKKHKGIKTEGYILGMSELFSEKGVNIPNNIQRVVSILGAIKDFEESYEKPGYLRYNQNVNVYGLDVNDFLKIIEFIDSKISQWINWVNEYDKFKELTSKVVGYGKQCMIEGEYLEFIEFKFPGKSEEIRELLK